jgi:hypothetical protein
VGSRRLVSTGDTSRATGALGERVPRLVGEKARTAGGMSCQLSTAIRAPRSFSGSHTRRLRAGRWWCCLSEWTGPSGTTTSACWTSRARCWPSAASPTGWAASPSCTPCLPAMPPIPNRSWSGSRPTGAAGGGTAGRRLPGVWDQPVGAQPLPRPPRGLGRQVRPRRRQAAGRPGAHQPAQPPPGRWGLPARRGGQGAGPCAAAAGLGPPGPGQHFAERAAGVLPRGRWRRSGPAWPAATP